MRLDGSSVALVTGGASGLGRAAVRRLHELGAAVVVADLPGPAGPGLAEQLGGRATFVPADVRDEAQLQGAVDAATAMGRLRVAVCCAGVATPGRVLGRRGVLALADFQTVVDINLVGTFNTLRLAAAAMADNDLLDEDRGVVVMTASVAAFDGQVGQAAYAASKGGVVGLTLTAARDLADKAVRVVTIAPGTFETPMMAGLPAEVRAALERQVPHPARLGRPEEYAALVAHVVANPMLNGEVIRLDGALRLPPR